MLDTEPRQWEEVGVQSGADAHLLAEALIQPHFGFMRDFDRDRETLLSNVTGPATCTTDNQIVDVAVTAHIASETDRSALEARFLPRRRRRTEIAVIAVCHLRDRPA